METGWGRGIGRARASSCGRGERNNIITVGFPVGGVGRDRESLQRLDGVEGGRERK